MKVLITGAAGRIGAHLTRACLETGHDVRAFVVPGDPRVQQIRLPGVELVEGDLRDRDMLQRIGTGVDAIVHLAGALTSRGNTDREFIDLNLNATFDLLVAARAGSPNLQRFVYASSDAVYATGAPAESLPIDERTPVQPGSVYGASKAGAEQLCLSFWRSEGFPATSLRFGATCDAAELIDPASVFARWLYLHAARDFLAALPARSLAQEKTLAHSGIVRYRPGQGDRVDRSDHSSRGAPMGRCQRCGRWLPSRADRAGGEWRDLQSRRSGAVHHGRACPAHFVTNRHVLDHRAGPNRASTLVSQQRKSRAPARLRSTPYGFCHG